MPQYKCDVELQEVVLRSGAVVRCRPVPPYTYDEVIENVPEPEYPYVQVGSRKVGFEKRPALRDTPEFEQYQKAYTDYRMAVGLAVRDHKLQFGIVNWVFPGMDQPVDMPPDDWEVPRLLHSRYGVETADDPWERRLQFIRYTLIQTDSDSDAIDAVLSPQSRPITADELKDGMRPFESGDGTEQQKSPS